METIEVRYKPILTGDVYHKYIIYTDSNGDQFIARGGPENGDGYDDRGGIDNSFPGTFGKVVTEVKVYDPISNQTPDVDSENDDPRETIISGADLSVEWANIVYYTQNFDFFDYQYQPMGQNSNAVVDNVLQSSGLPEPILDSTYISPGSGASFSIFLPPHPISDLADWLTNGVLTRFETAKTEASPLVLDLDGDGIELLAQGSVYWDLDQDGMAEASGWVGPDDGLLALDRNGDGVITEHSELFGTENIDGFHVLETLDSNADGIINSNDDAFSDLLVWQDANSDGVSQLSELSSLADLNITSIDLGYSTTNQTINGNSVRTTSTFTMNVVHETIVDAWFAYDNVNAVYAQDYILDARTLFLPTLRGYGTSADLHIAMSLDNGTGGLLEKVQDISSKTLSELLDPVYDFETKMRDILFDWTGVDGVLSNSRGDNIDARELSFLETLTNENFEQRGSSDPLVEGGQTLENAFTDGYNAVSARLLMQAAGQEIFSQTATYNPMTDEFDGSFVLDLTALQSLITGLALSGTDYQDAWEVLIRLIEGTIELDNLSAADRATLESMITTSDPALTLTLQDVLDQIYDNTGLTLNGTNGDDVLLGGVANDRLDTGLGNDRLEGGAGDDTLLGGDGNDVYFYESGIDTIIDSDGIDEIEFDSPTTSSQISIGYSDTNENDLYIYIDGNLAIRVEDYFTTSGGSIETLRFSNGTSIDLSSLTGIIEGTNGNDTLTGNDNASFLSDTIVGYDGNDTLDGGLGNDVLNGGLGDDDYTISSGLDVIVDTGGTDSLTFGTGLNSTDVSYEIQNDTDLIVSFFLWNALCNNSRLFFC